MTQPHPPADGPARPGSTTGRTGARVIDLADPDWCWARLRQATRGILSASHLERPRGLDVACTLVDRHLLLTPEQDRNLLPVLADRELTLGLAGRGDDGLRWVVRVTGVAALTCLPFAPDALEDCRDSHPARGAGPRAGNALLLPVGRLRGYSETPLDTEPVTR